MIMYKILKDKLMAGDKIKGALPMPNLSSNGFWARTQVIGGYGVKYGPTGISSLDEQVFSTHNMVPLGGVQYAMSKIFDAPPSIYVPTIYEQLGIGLPNKPIEDFVPYQYDIPAISGDTQLKNTEYPLGHHVCMFGIGITGTAENNITQIPVEYTENSITMTRLTDDGTLLDGVMIPFRYTANDLTEVEQTKYFGKKQLDDGIMAYYLKRFETEPVIRHYYKTTDDADYIDAVDNTVWSSFSKSPIDTFTELVLKINSRDVKQWAEANDGLESCRVNTVALFAGVYNPFGYTGTDSMGQNIVLGPDYQNVTMFSKLTIPVEPLQLNKDLDIIYRVYGC